MCMHCLNSLADGADEAGWVVGFPEGRHHLSFNKVATAMAACSMQPLVVQCAQILAILHEETTLGQVTTTHWTHTQTHTVMQHYCPCLMQSSLFKKCNKFKWNLFLTSLGKKGILKSS